MKLQIQIFHLISIVLLLVLFTTPAIHAQVDESVALPEEIEGNVEELNRLMDDISTKNNSYKVRVTELARELEDLDEQGKAASSQGESRELAEKWYNVQAKLNNELHSYYREVNELSDELIQVAETLRRQEPASEEAQEKVDEVLADNERRLQRIKTEQLNTAVLAQYANLPDHHQSEIDLEDELNAGLASEIESLQKQIENDGRRLEEHTGELNEIIRKRSENVLAQARSINGFSEVMLNRIEVWAHTQKPFTELMNIWDRFGKVWDKLDNLTDGFDDLTEIANNFISSSPNWAEEARIDGIFDSQVDFDPSMSSPQDYDSDRDKIYEERLNDHRNQ